LPTKRLPYRTKPSGLLGRVRRPLIDLEIFSHVTQRWITVTDVLVDTGADVSLVPQHLGQLLVSHVAAGRAVHVRGVAPTRVSVFLHSLRVRLDGKTMRVPVAIAISNDVPPILGRVRGLDRFNVAFLKGRTLQLAW